MVLHFVFVIASRTFLFDYQLVWHGNISALTEFLCDWKGEKGAGSQYVNFII